MKPHDDSIPAAGDGGSDTRAGKPAPQPDQGAAPQPSTERNAPAGEIRPEHPPHDPAARPDTRTQRGTADEEPRLPHEHDESADSQQSEPRKVIRQAQKDLERGLVDTDKGPVLDSVYERQKPPTDKGS